MLLPVLGRANHVKVSGRLLRTVLLDQIWLELPESIHTTCYHPLRYILHAIQSHLRKHLPWKPQPVRSRSDHMIRSGAANSLPSVPTFQAFKGELTISPT